MMTTVNIHKYSHTPASNVTKLPSKLASIFIRVSQCSLAFLTQYHTISAAKKVLIFELRSVDTKPICFSYCGN